MCTDVLGSCSRVLLVVQCVYYVSRYSMSVCSGVADSIVISLTNQELLSAEQQQQFPGRVSLLGSTLAESSPIQQRGPLRVMNAWAPPAKDQEDLSGWDNRPLRERMPASSPSQAEDAEAGSLPPLIQGRGGRAVDWRNLEVPRASQIRGVARIQPPGSYHRLAPKGWREPPELRASPPPHSPIYKKIPPDPLKKPTTGIVVVNRTCPGTLSGVTS